MKSVVIDFSKPKQTSQYPKVGWMLLASGLLTLGVSIFVSRPAVIDDSTPDIVETQEELSVGPSSEKEATERESRIEHDPRWARAASNLMMPWIELLSDIEQAAREPVLLLSIKPDIHEKRLDIEGECHELEGVLRFLDKLHESQFVTSAYLANHEEVVSEGGGKTIKFVIRARLKR